MADEELKEAEKELAAMGESLKGRGGEELLAASTMSPEWEARSLFAALYLQVSSCLEVEGDETGDVFVAYSLEAVKETKLTDAQIRETRKRHKAANEYRATLEDEARAQGGKRARIVCELMPAWLKKLDAALARELTERRKQAAQAKIEAAKERLIDTNPYSGQFREQYAARETRGVYLPMPQNVPILEYLLTPCTERNCELTKNGDTLVRARRGYSYLVLAGGRMDEKTGELIEMTRSNAFTAACTLMQILLQIPRQGELDPAYPKLSLDLYEMMASRGLKNEQNARVQFARDLQILQCTTIPATSEELLGKHYSILQERDVPKRGGKITAVLGKAFYKELIPWLDNLMPLPTSLLTMNAKKDSIALVCGLQLAFSQFYHYGEKAAKTGVKGSEIARRVECLLPSEEALRAGGRHYRQQRIDPIFKAVDRLTRNMTGAALNVDLRRLSDFSGATHADDLAAICLNATGWQHYPDITAERAEARKARASKRNASRGGKKQEAKCADVRGKMRRCKRQNAQM